MVFISAAEAEKFDAKLQKNPEAHKRLRNSAPQGMPLHRVTQVRISP